MVTRRFSHRPALAGTPFGTYPTQTAEAASPEAFQIRQKEELRAAEAQFSADGSWAGMPTPMGHPDDGDLPL